MGIALFAYMDGQTHRSKTIVGVIIGATAAATSAVFKVRAEFYLIFQIVWKNKHDVSVA